MTTSWYCCNSSCYYGTGCPTGCCNSLGTCASSTSSCYAGITYTGLNVNINPGGLAGLLLLDPFFLVKVIVGSVVGAQFLAALIFFLVWFCKRRQRLSKMNQVFATSTSALEMSYAGLPNTKVT